MRAAPAPMPDEVLWLRAGPRGNRSGFAVLPDGLGGCLTVTVLPKAWCADQTGSILVQHSVGDTTHIVVHETERVAVSSRADATGQFATTLSDLPENQADLLSLGSRSDEMGAWVPPKRGSYNALLDLMLLAGRGRPIASKAMFEGDFEPSLLVFPTHADLLAKVEAVLFSARPKYREVTEVLRVPRGRLSEPSLVRSSIAGTPWVECTFDELSTDTPMLQVVAAALREVAGARRPKKLDVLYGTLQVRAASLLHHFSTVTRLGRTDALRLGERLRLGVLERTWAPVVGAALEVLRARAILPLGVAHETKATLVQVSTENFWEQCLEAALKTAFTDVAVDRADYAYDEVSVPAPWAPVDAAHGPGSSRPDFVFKTQNRVIVADAKYKMGGLGGKATVKPSHDDGYQMFAYSHLVRWQGQPSEIGVLIYPGPPGAVGMQRPLLRLRDQEYPLWLATLPFPSRDEVQTPQNWARYVGRLAETLKYLAIEWHSMPYRPVVEQ